MEYGNLHYIRLTDLSRFLHFRRSFHKNECDNAKLQLLLSEGSCDGTIRVWEVETGRCLKVWNVGGDVRNIAWNPSPDRPILAAVV